MFANNEALRRAYWANVVSVRGDFRDDLDFARTIDGASEARRWCLALEAAEGAIRQGNIGDSDAYAKVLRFGLTGDRTRAIRGRWWIAELDSDPGL